MDRASSLMTGKRAVIVEDEGITVMQLRRVLDKAGLRVVGTAGTGREAIELVLFERPDIVLMDVNMPGDINGLDAAETILSLYPVCIVILTAYEDDDYRRRAADLNTCGYVVKPVVSHTLIPEIENALGQWGQSDSQ